MKNIALAGIGMSLAVAVGACAPDTGPHLNIIGDYPGVEPAVQAYYKAHAIEGSGECTAPEMVAVTESTRFPDIEGKLSLAVQYDFKPATPTIDGKPAPDECTGNSTRQFIVDNSGSDVTVASMTGETR